MNALGRMASVLVRHPLPPALAARVETLRAAAEAPAWIADALVVERAFGLDLFRYLEEEGWGTLALRPVGAVFNVVPARDRLHFLQLSARAVALGRRPYARAREGWVRWREDLEALPRGDIVCRYLHVTTPVFAERCAGYRAHLRLTAEAVRLEEQRGPTGALPGGLAETVTALDPFTGAPLRCREKEDGYRLWSVGPDGGEEAEAGAEDMLPTFGEWFVPAAR